MAGGQGCGPGRCSWRGRRGQWHIPTAWGVGSPLESHFPVSGMAKGRGCGACASGTWPLAAGVSPEKLPVCHPFRGY